MNTIINGLSYALGLLMDLFFRGLTFVGYPRLWACIVLFAIVTRFLFLPERIKKQRSKLLAPVVRRDLLDADPNFFEKTKDKEITVERAILKKQINKKYKLSNGSGCLTFLIQYPVLVALFYVVKHPQEFIPSLESIANSSSTVYSFLGVNLSDIPFDSMIDVGSVGLIVFVPLLVMASTFIKMFPSLKLAKTFIEKIKVYSLCFVFTILIGGLSAKLPLAISLYWITNDCTYMIFDFVIHKLLPKTKFISSALEEYKASIRENSAKPSLEIDSNIQSEEGADSEVITQIDENNKS